LKPTLECSGSIFQVAAAAIKGRERAKMNVVIAARCLS
jgi:hypothetical protein